MKNPNNFFTECPKSTMRGGKTKTEICFLHGGIHNKNQKVSGMGRLKIFWVMGL